jgi:hypothetical protein
MRTGFGTGIGGAGDRRKDERPTNRGGGQPRCDAPDSSCHDFLQFGSPIWLYTPWLRPHEPVSCALTSIPTCGYLELRPIATRHAVDRLELSPDPGDPYVPLLVPRLTVGQNAIPLGAVLDARRVGGHCDRDLVARIAHHIERGLYRLVS